MNFGTSNKYIAYSVNSQETQVDTNNNKSILTVWIDAWRTNSGYTTYGSGTVYARINGGVYSAGISTSQKITSTPIRLGTWTVEIYHNDDGTKSVGVSGWINHSQFNSGEQGYTHTLTTIARATQPNVSKNNPTLGTAITINCPRASGSFTHNLSWWCGNISGVIANGVSTAVSWTVPTSIATQYPNDTYGAVGIHCDTYNGGTYIGRKDVYITGVIPDSFVPNFSSIKLDKINAFGDLILQNKSSVKITAVGASGSNGSTIKKYEISGGNYNYSGTQNNYTTDVLMEAGQIIFTVTVTDTRNRTAKKTVTVSVVEYSMPTLTLEAYRCRSNGTKDYVDGNYINIKPTFTFSKVTGNDISTRYIKINNVVKNTTFVSGKDYIYGTYPLDQEHVVEVCLEDKAGTKIKPITFIVGVAIIPFQLPLSKNGLGIGKMCEAEGEMQVGYDLNVFGKVLVNSKEQPVFELVETIDLEI